MWLTMNFDGAIDVYSWLIFILVVEYYHVLFINGLKEEILILITLFKDF